MSSMALMEVLEALPAAELEAAAERFTAPIQAALPDERLRRSAPQAILGILGSRSPVIGAIAQSLGRLAVSTWAAAKRFYTERIGIPLAATGLIHPVWAMVAMAVSVTAIFFNSLWGTPRLFFDAIRSVGQPIVNVPAPQAA